MKSEGSLPVFGKQENVKISAEMFFSNVHNRQFIIHFLKLLNFSHCRYKIMKSFNVFDLRLFDNPSCILRVTTEQNYLLSRRWIYMLWCKCPAFLPIVMDSYGWLTSHRDSESVTRGIY